MNRNAMVLTRFPMAEVRFVAIVVFIFVYLAVLGGCSKPYHPPESFGVPNHQPLDDQELKAALSRAKQLASLGQFDDPDFQNILARLSPHFPVVPVMVGRQPEPWTRIQLNSTGAEFGAIRFSSPLKVPANLWVAVAYESRTLLGLGIRQCGAKSEVSGAGSALFKQGLALEGVDLPDKNTMIQFVRGGINPGEEYYLHIEFDDPSPMAAYAKLKVIPVGQGYSSFDERLFAAVMGIPYPYPQNSSAPLWPKVVDLIRADRRAGEALLLVEQAMQTPPVPRNTRLLHANLLLIEGQWLRQSGDGASATVSFLKSAQEMRLLAKDFDELEPAERNVYAVAMYREACCQALAGQTQEALRSLRDALRHGFTQSETVTANKELDSLWELAEFKELINLMQSPGSISPDDPRNGIVPDSSKKGWIENLTSRFSGTSRVVLAISTIATFLAVVARVFRRVFASRFASSSGSPGKPLKPWSFRFSVRGLAIFIAMLCAFLGAWDITKRYGAVTSTIDRWVIREGEDGIVGSYRSTKFENSPFPFVICRGVSDRVETRRYFLWLFGFEQLLLERQLDHTSEWEEHLNDNQVSSIEAVRAQNLLLDYVLE